MRTVAYGSVPVAWTTHLWLPQQVAGMLADAGPEPVSELRLPADASGHLQVALTARRPG
ncbi:hypothetical protein ACI8AK_14985 [Geodermatophilus sp. SYSU D00867]